MVIPQALSNNMYCYNTSGQNLLGKTVRIPDQFGLKRGREFIQREEVSVGRRRVRHQYWGHSRIRIITNNILLDKFH